MTRQSTNLPITWSDVLFDELPLVPGFERIERVGDVYLTMLGPPERPTGALLVSR